MRLLILLMWIASFAVQGQNADFKPRVAPAPAPGVEYVPLERWAEANQMQFTLLKKEEEVRLTNRWTRLSFKVNSQRADVDGVTVFLAFPLLWQQGAVMIAQKDIDRSLRPILFPARSKSKQRVQTVAVAAGHGGKDCGYRIGGELEKKYTLLLAEEVQRALARAGMKPVLIRKGDEFVDLEDRARRAKHAHADVYLELHYNCANPGNTESKGLEVYCLTPAGANSTNGGTDSYGTLPGNRQDERNMLLAYKIHRSMLDSLDLADRGIRRARFVVLRNAEMPAVLVEAGFMSQPEEMRRIRDEACRRQTAQAILDGLLAYKRLVER